MSSSVSHLIYTNPLLLILFAALLLNVTLATTNYQGNETDSLSLLAFKSNLHDPQGVLNSWNSSVHFCQWQGITCGLRHRRAIVLDLSSSGLVGSLSPNIGNLSFLRHIALKNNSLQGQIPPQIGRLFRLQNLFLYNNSLEREIPANLSHCTSLVRISLGNNKLVGVIPRELTTFSNLIFLSVTGNYLWGEIWRNKEADDMAFLNSLTNCSDLEILQVNYNQLGGVLPNSLGNLSTRMRCINVAENQISGVIPSGFGGLFNLEILKISKNQFEGEIPYVIGEMKKLRYLKLSKNSLSGQIPTSLGNLSFLSIVFLQDNKLEGTIPLSLGNCKNLLSLDLSQNNIGGRIPLELFNASAIFELSLAQNHLVGPMPSQVGNLKNLVKLDVSENRLSGEIPTKLRTCSALVDLSLRVNFFEGSIPPSFESLKSIQNLDISSNNLSGTIPIFLANFSLKSLNLSFNNFEGELPTNGVFSNVSAIFVVGNNGLCGGISALQLPRCETRTLKEQRLSRFHIILISGGCLLLVASMVSLFMICWFKKKKLGQSYGSFPMESFLTVSYGDLLKATDGFSLTNLIGVGSFGSVYKGILDREEKTVAVKVLNLQRQGASKSFIAECKALRNIRHRNLVKIITLSSSIDFQGNDFKALVYEFMPSGSLERWLNSSRDTYNGQDEHHILNLHQRINIAMDVARALEYLHFQCEKPIVHCDIKPSNILLDRDMVAHVGDFGLAKFLPPELSNANQSSLNGIRGTVGYIAPEYGLGCEASINGDVYSYGILLLEMMTGRSPIDLMFNESLNLHNFAKMALPYHVKEIVEPKLLSNNEEVETTTSNNMQSRGQSRSRNSKEDCLISMVKIGVACSMELPQDRMDLNQVIRELYSVKSILRGT
ncbi:hypothetical protein LguiA_030751 [Lonicera macranthoides]